MAPFVVCLYVSTAFEVYPLNMFNCFCSEWYLNGNYLVVFVSVGIILPLSLLKNLGKDSHAHNSPHALKAVVQMFLISKKYDPIV